MKPWLSCFHEIRHQKGHNKCDRLITKHLPLSLPLSLSFALVYILETPETTKDDKLWKKQGRRRGKASRPLSLCSSGQVGEEFGEVDTTQWMPRRFYKKKRIKLKWRKSGHKYFVMPFGGRRLPTLGTRSPDIIFAGSPNSACVFCSPSFPISSFISFSFSLFSAFMTPPSACP